MSDAVTCMESNEDVLTVIYDPNGNALTCGEIVAIINQLRADVGGGDTAIRALETEVEVYQQQIGEMRAEVSSVLLLMDGLAEQWGDEGVFRRCRDRLRALVTEDVA